MKSGMYRIVCFLILLPCILFNQNFANAYNINIDGNLDEYDLSIFKSYHDLGNSISFFSMAKLTDKDNKKLYLAFNIQEEKVNFNKDVSSLKININNDKYLFTVYCSDTVISQSKDINIIEKCLIKDDGAYSTEICVEFNDKMPSAIVLSIQVIDSKDAKSNVIKIEEETSKRESTSGSKPSQKSNNTEPESASKSLKNSTAKKSNDSESTAVKSTNVNSQTAKVTKSSTPKNGITNSAEYSIEQNKVGNDAQNAVQINASSQYSASNKNSNNIKKILGIIIAVILLAFAAVLPIIEHKKSKKDLTKEEADDLTETDGE